MTTAEKTEGKPGSFITDFAEVLSFVVSEAISKARSQNCKKRLLASSCPFVRMELGPHWTDFHEI